MARYSRRGWIVIIILGLSCPAILRSDCPGGGTCTLSWSGSGGEGTKVCPATVSVYDTYSIDPATYSSACNFVCAPQQYDSTYTPRDCESQFAAVRDPITFSVLSASEASRSNGTFNSTDCQWHYLYIQTTETDANGTRSTHQGAHIGLMGDKNASGNLCP
jgi:hypothetical protein